MLVTFIFTFFFLDLLTCGAVANRPSSQYVPDNLSTREAKIVGRLLELMQNNKTSGQLAADAGRDGVKKSFTCPHLARSSTAPDSVHKLRPSDVNVVAAMGDSLTAGRGASGGVVGLLVDYRGLSWSIGGDGGYEDIGTLPNILRKYNPNLYGFSTGVGNRDRPTSRFNVAKTGDESVHMIEQANLLVQRLRDDPNVNFDLDWKVITVFIGGNDLCDYCFAPDNFTVEKYTQHLEGALDILHAQVPRAFVNLVEVLNGEVAQDLAKGLLCHAVHIYACDCAANPKSRAAEDYLIKLKNGYQQAARDLASSGRYDTRDDFTVVLQPFYRNTYLPRTDSGDVDYSYFASDCFHHSRKGQRAVAEALWNNMIEPVGSKRLEWTPDEPIECPSEKHPYFFTSKNSKNQG